MTKKAFRDFLHDLDDAGEIQRVAKPVDPRDLSGLAAQTDKAVLFDEIEGYPGWRVATALLSSRRRLAITLDCAEDRIAQEFEARSARAIAPDLVGNAPCQEVVMEGDEVDLAALPFPLMHVYDGGPYISGTFVVSRDAEYGRNAGSYRLMYRNRRETGIDLVSPVRHAVLLPAHAGPGRAAADRGRGRRPPVRDAGGLLQRRRSPTTSWSLPAGCTARRCRWSSCKTVDLEVPADSEIVLEGEILPIGWTADEGPFGEFSQISGDVKWNPVFRVNCITHRRRPDLLPVADAVGERLAVERG